jgi:pilus assembly protein CpaB
MNRNRTILVMILAVVLALVASGATYKFLSERGRQADRARLQTVGIVVAAVDIPIGSTIAPNQVSVAAWPRDSYPKDAFAETKPVTGRVARRDFLRGEPIVDSKLVPADKSSGILSLKVPPGMRAFSVKVNEVVGVGGFIVPDARVDVVVTTARSSERQQEQVSKTFLQDVLVLAAGQVIEQKDNKPITVNTVTLAVTPEDAEKLALASNDGKIQLVLRHYADGQKVDTPGSDKGRLLASYRGTPPPAVKKEAPRKKRTVVARAQAVSRPPASPPAVQPVKASYSIEVIRGNKRTEEKLE